MHLKRREFITLLGGAAVMWPLASAKAAQIFISYSKPDRELALKLSAYLESEGWSVWWDKSLGAGDTFRDEIMKQLAAARAVITIWSKNSIHSDWVRAEAGRAKADGKLIPVKTPDVNYADIPLPFGEMHVENVTATELIRAAVVAQLSKPAIPLSSARQVAGALKYQFLTWIGIVGTAITLFTNIGGVIDLADWARDFVRHWHDWTAAIWISAFSWTGIHIPRWLTAVLSFVLFVSLLVIGINFHRMRQGISSSISERRRRLVLLFAGMLLNVLVTSFFLTPISLPVFEFIGKVSPNFYGVLMLWCLWLGPSIVFLVFTLNEKLWVLLAAGLFIVCDFSLLMAPFLGSYPGEGEVNPYVFGVGLYFSAQFCLIAVVLFTPIRQLTQRLTLIVLLVLTLVALSEISKLNLRQYLIPHEVIE
jgi:hypothetical protein